MASKIILPNGCLMSTPSVNPKNWRSGGIVLLDTPWRIQYYFYPDDGGKPKLVVVKGMNSFDTLTERRCITKVMIENEIEENKRGYNPINKSYNVDGHKDSELHPFLDFVTVFRIAIAKIQCSDVHYKQMEWCVERINKKVVKLGLQNITIESLKRRQLKQILENCYLPNGYYNKYLIYLSRIFG